MAIRLSRGGYLRAILVSWRKPDSEGRRGRWQGRKVSFWSRLTFACDGPGHVLWTHPSPPPPPVSVHILGRGAVITFTSSDYWGICLSSMLAYHESLGKNLSCCHHCGFLSFTSLRTKTVAGTNRNCRGKEPLTWKLDLRDSAVKRISLVVLINSATKRALF